jgi:hypothetical protein
VGEERGISKNKEVTTFSKLDYDCSNLLDLQYVGWLKHSGLCQDCEGYGRLYRFHSRNVRWKMVKTICMACSGAVKCHLPPLAKEL